MQIIPFPIHYQSVYTNFDISSFSLISCRQKVQAVQTKVQIVQTKVQIVQTKNASSADKVQTKRAFVYTRKIIDYQRFKTKSAECRQNSKNYIEEV